MNGTNDWFKLVVAVLATWRVTHLLAEEDGPAEIIVRIRARLGNSFLGSLMDCFYCLSLWIAAPAALYLSRQPLAWLLHWLAISGAACLLERVTREPQSDSEIIHHEFELQKGDLKCVADKNEEL
jgi:hypothetical protein